MDPAKNKVPITEKEEEDKFRGYLAVSTTGAVLIYTPARRLRKLFSCMLSELKLYDV